MNKSKGIFNKIPISISLNSTLEAEGVQARPTDDKKRLLIISLLAVFVAVLISFIAKLLVHLISFITNISFYGIFLSCRFRPYWF